MDSAFPQDVMTYLHKDPESAYPGLPGKKKDLFMAACKLDKWHGSDEKTVAQQAIDLRGIGFHQISFRNAKKSIDRALCLIYQYSYLGTQGEIEKQVAMMDARSGDLDKEAQQSQTAQ